MRWTFICWILSLYSVRAYPQNISSQDFFMMPQSDVNKLIDSARRHAYPLVRALPADYVTNGTVDYRYYIQHAIDQHAVVAFPPFPILINDSGLTIHSHQLIFFPPGSLIKLLPSKQPGYQILRIHDVEHVAVFFPHIVGDASQHLDNKGEWGMGISIRGSRDVLIYYPDIEYCWGDGIYIGDEKNPVSREVKIMGGNIAHNRRNGISVISADSLIIDSTVLSFNTGTWPKAGIDIEPNVFSNAIDHIILNRLHTYGNYAGIIINLNALNTGVKPVYPQITIQDPVDSASTFGLWFVKIRPNKTNTNLVQGEIQVIHGRWMRNSTPVLINDYLNQHLGPRVQFLSR